MLPKWASCVITAQHPCFNLSLYFNMQVHQLHGEKVNFRQSSKSWEQRQQLHLQNNPVPAYLTSQHLGYMWTHYFYTKKYHWWQILWKDWEMREKKPVVSWCWSTVLFSLSCWLLVNQSFPKALLHSHFYGPGFKWNSLAFQCNNSLRARLLKSTGPWRGTWRCLHECVGPGLKQRSRFV